MKATLIQTDTKKEASGPDLKTKAEQTKLLRNLFMNQLKEIYWAEKAMVRAFPILARSAERPELVDALSEHLEATTDHVARLERAFAYLYQKAEGKKCEAIEGLIKEAGQMINEFEKGVVRDSGIILA